MISIATEPFPGDPSQDVQYKVDVNMVDSSRREIRASQAIKVTRRAFTISLDPQKQIYQPGDTIKVSVKSQNANAQPVAFDGERRVYLVKQRESRNAAGEIEKKGLYKERDMLLKKQSESTGLPNKPTKRNRAKVNPDAASAKEATSGKLGEAVSTGPTDPAPAEKTLAVKPAPSPSQAMRDVDMSFEEQFDM